ncbi:hypothetical protein [Akkermansia sp.]|uniref:hypothetical protein n=1 Tax=Akkermansia sp. TaxID=1872421 RepID=UPI0025C16602|nr:hypothetical protein [Akkermansia sp.]
MPQPFKDPECPPLDFLVSTDIREERLDGRESKVTHIMMVPVPGLVLLEGLSIKPLRAELLMDGPEPREYSSWLVKTVAAEAAVPNPRERMEMNNVFFMTRECDMDFP